jgi:hypothetical protein
MLGPAGADVFPRGCRLLLFVGFLSCPTFSQAWCNREQTLERLPVVRGRYVSFAPYRGSPPGLSGDAITSEHG